MNELSPNAQRTLKQCQRMILQMREDMVQLVNLGLESDEGWNDWQEARYNTLCSTIVEIVEDSLSKSLFDDEHRDLSGAHRGARVYILLGQLLGYLEELLNNHAEEEMF